MNARSRATTPEMTAHDESAGVPASSLASIRGVLARIQAGKGMLPATQPRADTAAPARDEQKIVQLDSVPGFQAGWPPWQVHLELGRLRSEIERLLAEKKGLSIEINRMEHEQDELRRELTEALARLASVDTPVSPGNPIDTAAADHSALQLEKFEREITEARTAEQAASARLAHAGSLLEQANNRIQSLERQAAEADQAREQWESRLRGNSETLDALQARLDEAVRALGEARQTADAREAQALASAGLSQRNETLEKELETLQTARTDLQNQLTAKESETSLLRAELASRPLDADLEEQRALAASAVRELHQQIERQTAEIERLQSALAEAAAQVPAPESRIPEGEKPFAVSLDLESADLARSLAETIEAELQKQRTLLATIAVRAEDLQNRFAKAAPGSVEAETLRRETGQHQFFQEDIRRRVDALERLLAATIASLRV